MGPGTEIVPVLRVTTRSWCVHSQKGTVGSASPCASGECLVHYYAGEFFLAASPGWLKASSLGLLSADSHSVVVTLKEGVRPATTAR